MKTSFNDVIKVGIIDDHVTVTRAIGTLLNSMNGICCILEAFSGEHLLRLLESAQETPDILLMDVEMNEMNGIEATVHITAQYPLIKVIAFTGIGTGSSIIKMIAAGACAYMMKHASPAEIEAAIKEVHRKGKYHADIYHMYASEIRRYNDEVGELSFTENEKRFLQFLCKGYPYRKIAETMNLSIDSINYYHTCLSRKMNTPNQAVMALEALRLGIVTLDNAGNGKISGGKGPEFKPRGF
jgi:DNA-binding NarL/FixJ family response regulator